MVLQNPQKAPTQTQWPLEKEGHLFVWYYASPNLRKGQRAEDWGFPRFHSVLLRQILASPESERNVDGTRQQKPFHHHTKQQRVICAEKQKARTLRAPIVFGQNWLFSRAPETSGFSIGGSRGVHWVMILRVCMPRSAKLRTAFHKGY